MKRVLLFALALAAILVPAISLAQTATGTMVGTVLDDKGAGLPGVTITVSNPDTGYSRTAVSSATGDFRLNAVLAGTYQVKAEMSGFATVVTEGVTVNVASTRTLTITLRLAQVAESLTVTAEQPLVENTAAVGAVVSENQLQSLPLNGRQFANLAILAPGTQLARNTDPTKPGQLTVALNGGSGRNVNYIMDGGDNTDDTIGGALQNFSIESVQEFKIQTMGYKAEYGRSSGGVLTVVTKSGTNQLHGSAYGFFRNDALNAKTQTEINTGASKQDYDRKQYGFSIGGPIVKDKLHFFLTAERTDRKTFYTVDSGGIDPSIDGQSFPTPFKDDLVSAKVTYDISLQQYLQVRYGYQKNSDKYGVSSLAAPSNLATVNNKYQSILVGHTAMIGADMLNEFVFQYTKFNNAIVPDSNDPLIYYPGGYATGQSGLAPQTTNQVKYQYRDDFTLPTVISGQDHTFKFGGMFINEPTLGGDFTTGTSGIYTLANNPAGGYYVTDITQFGGFSGDKTPSKQYSAYVQDDWKVSNQLTVAVGLRYDYYDALRLDQSSNPILQTLSTQTTYNESYLKDFQGWDGKTHNSKNGWAPRLGFTWDVTASGRQLLRGSVGRFYDFPYSNATVLFPAMAVQSTYGIIFENTNTSGIRNQDGSYYQVGQPWPENQIPPGTTAPRDVASPTLKPPYSDQATLGYSWQVNNWLGLSSELVYAKYENIPFRFRANPFDPARGGERRFPEFASFRIWYGKGSAKYKGFNLGFRARSEKLEVQGFYTLSETTGNILAGADEFRITQAEYQPDLGAVRDQTVDPYDPLCKKCYGPLNTDSRHKFTISATYQLPLDFSLSGMFRYRSATPYTEWDSSLDPNTNNDGYTFELRPGTAHVNIKRGHDFSQFDMRFAKAFKFGGDIKIEVLAEIFNLFNTTNPAGYRGDRADSGPGGSYGTPSSYAGDTGQGEQRLWQIGLRFAF
jgi:outer membrane receptor protein involved in Fe transport